jgi:hypothetical protein
VLDGASHDLFPEGVDPCPTAVDNTAQRAAEGGAPSYFLSRKEFAELSLRRISHLREKFRNPVDMPELLATL